MDPVQGTPIGETPVQALPQFWTEALAVPPASGSRLARFILRVLGWRLDFQGLPAMQGVILVYPHTSNWDFVVGILAKWALGLHFRFWGKDSLFRMPLFGAWVRYLGGVPVNRGSSQGVVGDTAELMKKAGERQEMFWLAVAPEGTRSWIAGWRTGAYHVAVQARVPVGLAYLDFASRRIGLTQFVRLSGDVDRDFALFKSHLCSVRGLRAEQASPIQALASHSASKGGRA